MVPPPPFEIGGAASKILRLEFLKDSAFMVIPQRFCLEESLSILPLRLLLFGILGVLPFDGLKDPAFGIPHLGFLEEEA